MAEYKNLGPEAMIVNWIGILIALFGTLTIYLASNSRFKRLNRPEDEMLLTETMND